MNSSGSGQAPLDGITVVSLEQAVAAPLATSRLADAGARVIKIERPEGDFARGYDVAADGASSYFAWLNRGKESIALDLTDDDDRKVMTALVAAADVFVQNLAAGAAGRLGFGSAELRERRPELITCDISGYGPDGPYATAKAYDLLIQAESGLLAVSGAPGPPGRIGVSVADIGTGTNAAVAMLQALVRRERTGEGASLELSLFESMAEWMTVPLLHHDYLDAAPGRIGLAHPSIAPYGGFATADGATILIAVQSDREWGVLCRTVMDRSDLVDDPRFATNNDRADNRSETDAAVGEAFGRRSLTELRNDLDRVRIAYGVINEVADLAAHPQLHRYQVEHASGAPMLPMPPARVDWEHQHRVPALDEHGAALRAEFS